MELASIYLPTPDEIKSKPITEWLALIINDACAAIDQ
ncbi:hypothetical protein [Ralstonia phage RP12]|uniref:Uncharacterized protein n=1 Tax=Ralstonia phage RP12 TaxID=1923889 RepID=A0A1L7N0L0_9CAUD|nr:hypothetical protein FDH28_gp028 [Ralstonia phage RP12]BAW19002.1 hypothetical protein [Ralstonia phage RP12]